MTKIEWNDYLHKRRVYFSSDKFLKSWEFWWAIKLTDKMEWQYIQNALYLNNI
jgi:hypothetical protein